MSLTYDEALDFLFPRTTTIKFGLDTTRALLAVAGQPARSCPSIHVGGTNGKGSVVDAGGARRWARRDGGSGSTPRRTWSPSASASGWTGVPIARGGGGDVDRAAPAAHPEREGHVLRGHHRASPSPTSRPAAPRSRWSRSASADGSTAPTWCSPLVSAVTKIELRPHEVPGRHAGADRLREGRHRQARRAVRDRRDATRPWSRCCAGKRGGRWRGRPRRGSVPTSGCCRRSTSGRGPLGLAGPHQRRNAAVAHGILMALPAPYRPAPDAVERAASACAWIAGRLDRRGRWLFDVAHNPDGVRALVASARRTRPAAAAPRAGLDPGRQGLARDAGRARPGVDRGILTMAPTAAGRGWDLDWLGRWLRRARPAAGAGGVDPGAGLRGGARARSSEGAGTVLVTGSFHTVGDVMQRARDCECLSSRHRFGPASSLRPYRIIPPHVNPRPSRAFAISIPADLALRAHIFGTWRAVAARYGFEEYDGPPLEPLELYTAKSGDEIVGQLYNFTDKGERRGRAAPGDDAHARAHGGGARQRAARSRSAGSPFRSSSATSGSSGAGCASTSSSTAT